MDVLYVVLRKDTGDVDSTPEVSAVFSNGDEAQKYVIRFTTRQLYYYIDCSFLNEI